MTSVAAPEETGKVTNMEFGRRIGCHHSTASRYRNGERIPSTDILLRIFAEFGLSAKQKDELSTVMDDKNGALTLSERRRLFGEWLRKYVFSQNTKEST
jgi:transcriptional regulator with XRE-family HTH domain